MKFAQFSLPLSAMLVIGLNQSTLAGPQSLLDPYASVKPPSAKKADAKKAAPVARPAAPSSVVINAPGLPPIKDEKPKKEKSVAIRDQVKPAPAPVVSKSAIKEAAPINSSSGTADGGEGFIAGTKQIFRGFGTAAKGAISGPAKVIASGGRKAAEGTKSMTSKVAEGSKSSGGIFLKGARSVGNGFKAMGSKIKDGTVAVGEKTMSVAHLGGGDKKDKAAEKTVAPKPAVASKPSEEAVKKEKELAAKVAKVPATEKIKAEGDEPIINETKIGASESGGGESLGGKVLAMPAKMGKGVMSAAAKTGEATKRVATAPIGFFGKLNPFHKKDVQLPPIRTAGTVPTPEKQPH